MVLEREVQTYKSRVTELTIKEQTTHSSTIRVSELETGKRSLQSRLDSAEDKYQTLNAEFMKLGVENQGLRAAARSSTEVSSLLSAKLGLEATVRQLNSKVEWAEGSNRTLEKEKKEAERRMV